ncbi:hypothetical protein ACHWQZ_G005192 [Mnemiopsis leidyi]
MSFLGDSSDMLSRFYESLLVTQRKNEELICTLEDSGMQIERLECTGESDPNSIMEIIATLRHAALETVRPNQNSSRELDGLMKLLEARLSEIRAQEKHNEKQILTIEKERRDVKSQKAALDEQKRLLANDKEKMEQKIDQERSELLARAEKLAAMAKIIEHEPECLEKSVIQEAERSKLKSELAVMKKTEEIKGLETMCERYQEEIKKVRDDAREAIKISENQAMEACKRLKQMNAELIKSQDTARKMQHILVTEKERNKELKASLDHERLQPISKHMQSSLTEGTVEGNLSTIPGLSRAMIQRAARAGNMPTAIRVEELLKKNESLRHELESTNNSLRDLQKEHSKVKDDCKTACSNLHYATMQVTTLKQSRDDTLQKLKKAQQNYELLNKSLTKQAAGWVQERLDERAVDRTNRMKRLFPSVNTAA